MSSSFTVNRRAFLAGGTAALSSLALPGLARASGAGPDRWQALRRIVGDRLVQPDSKGYAQAALPNNLRFRDVRPQGVAYCNSPQMVADVLNWCQDYDVPFAIRGGGHSYAGHSSSRDFVIDMRDLQSIDYDAGTQAVRVGAGALNGSVYGSLSSADRTITHGRCPTVGVAGFLLGGGIGFNMRRYGLGCDHVVSAEIVTADGKVRTVSANEEPDLFWALRGGVGGNFGVSTSFTLKTYSSDEMLTVFRIVWRKNTLAVAKALFAAADAAPDTLGTRIALGGVTPELHAGGRQVPVTLLGQFAGSEEELMKILAPVMAEAEPDFSDIQVLDYWDGQSFLMDEGEPGYYRERSGFMKQAPDAAFLEAAFEDLQRWPGTGAQSSLFFFQTGGRVNDVAADATAFVHRDSRWISVIGFTWSEDDLARPDIVRNASTWQDAAYATMNQHGSEGAYQNFPDSSLVDWRARYYGGNLDRLMQIKAAVDPNNLFRHAQSL